MHDIFEYRNVMEWLLKMIYIFSPVNAVTGGVELLQQLGYKIQKFGGEAKIIYRPTGFKNSFTYRKYDIPEVYEKYGLSYDYDFEDCKDNIVIVPETLAWILPQIKYAKKYLWWLSVDFFMYADRKIYTKMKMLGKKYGFDSKDVIHLVQSYYAYEWLINQGINNSNIYFLSDYLRTDFIKNSSKENERKKRQQFLYNPRKGLEFTEKIVKASRYKAIPLKGYTPMEMVNILQESMVYIDFGNHPGKDRIPREAAISGCCIITGRKGAAGNDVDICIPNEFKFQDDDASIDNIVSCIDYLMQNYVSERCKFDFYRRKIIEEENIFDNQVKELFI